MNSNDATLYREAAQVIRDGGLVKHAYGSMFDPTEPHCTVGAVRAAAFRRGHSGATMHLPQLALLAELLGADCRDLGGALGAIATWNDWPLTTAADVITLLEQAAQKVEADR